ncbi:hypothetical protein DM02DRAFT_730520 [Periconia macrospinosa]|uniref:MARVEL domain-containing protein n=1 Tax=Periconia macrospinosa TaxID=97972 RepID=A0A2V1DJT2_9PLEO|nr:hypothetical protein DM02DRAFT_730520 [Periconia macrospinosa]
MALKFFSRGSMKGEKAGAKNRLAANLTLSSAFRITLRLFQFVMGIVVIGLYATDLDRARKAGVYYDSKWMYATIVGAIASLASLIMMLPLIRAWFFFGVDAILFILYLTAFGIFGKMFIKEDPEGNKDIVRMKRAVWCLLTNMILWLITACYGAVIFWKSRKASTSLTGRGQEHP